MTLEIKHATLTGPITETQWVEPLDTSMGTGKLLGRSTGGAGAVEEIAVGSGLSLSGGTLATSGGGSVSLGPQVTQYSSSAYIVSPLSTEAMTNTAALANYLLVAPIFVMLAGTFTRIGVNVTTASAGSARLGLYNNSAANKPGTLLLDAGTVDTGTTGVKEITISQAMTPGLYWAAVVFSSTPSVTSFGKNQIVPILPQSSFDSRSASCARSFTFAALPADETSSSYTLGNAATTPVIALRAP